MREGIWGGETRRRERKERRWVERGLEGKEREWKRFVSWRRRTTEAEANSRSSEQGRGFSGLRFLTDNLTQSSSAGGWEVEEESAGAFSAALRSRKSRFQAGSRKREEISEPWLAEGGADGGRRRLIPRKREGEAPVWGARRLDELARSLLTWFRRSDWYTTQNSGRNLGAIFFEENLFSPSPPSSRSLPNHPKRGSGPVPSLPSSSHTSQLARVITF